MNRFGLGALLLALVAMLQGAEVSFAAECDVAYSSMKTDMRLVIDDTQDVTQTGSGPLGYVWVVTGEAFELVAKLHNADEDVTWKRLACASQSYTKQYVSVPSYPPTPPSGITLAEVQALLENARQQIETELGDIDASYLPCTTCMTSTEQLAVLTPMAEFSGATETKRQQVWPAAGTDPCEEWCDQQRSDYANGVKKHCDPNGANCAARPGEHDAQERLDCGLARSGTPNPTCRAEISWPCVGGIFRCKQHYDEDPVGVE